MDWDLIPFFDEFGNEAYRLFKSSLAADLKTLLETAENAPTLTDGTVEAWAELWSRCEALEVRSQYLESYLSCLASADAASEDYAADEAWLSALGAEFTKLKNAFKRSLAHASESAFSTLSAHPKCTGTSYRLDLLKKDAAQQMSAAEESLAADLSVHGIRAWSRLYFNLVGRLRFELKVPGQAPRSVPFAQRSSLISGSDRTVRQAAFEGANTALAAHEDTFAAALNAIAGERHTLNERRGIRHFLDVSCLDSRISHATLEALMQAIHKRRPQIQAIFRFRNQAAGLTNPAFHDLYAPLPESAGSETRIGWDEAVAMVQNAYSTAYPDFGNFFRRMIEERWIDYQPREAKRPGGFCTSSHRLRQSRIFMTFQGTMSDVMTLAHEAGHAWHSHCLDDQRFFASDYPMTLAESASTFGEMILSEGILNDPRVSDAQKRRVVDADTERAVAFFLDIPMRFEFERKFYEERRHGIVAPSRLKSLMTETQREIFGDTLRPDGLDPWFWASKLHFYIDNTLFYNYPYAFGYALSLALFGRFRAEGPAFLPAYRRFLEQTGTKSCEAVIRENLGEDITQPDFWLTAIDQVQIAFERLKTYYPNNR